MRYIPLPRIHTHLYNSTTTHISYRPLQPEHTQYLFLLLTDKPALRMVDAPTTATSINGVSCRREPCRAVASSLSSN